MNLSSKEGKSAEEVAPTGRFRHIVYNLNEVLGKILKVDGVSRYGLTTHVLGANDVAIQIDKVSVPGKRQKTCVVEGQNAPFTHPILAGKGDCHCDCHPRFLYEPHSTCALTGCKMRVIGFRSSL